MNNFHKNKLLSLFGSDSNRSTTTKSDQKQRQKLLTTAATTTSAAINNKQKSKKKGNNITQATTKDAMKNEICSKSSNNCTYAKATDDKWRSPRPATNLSQAISGLPKRPATKRKTQNLDAISDNQLAAVTPSKVSKKSSTEQATHGKTRKAAKNPKKKPKKVFEIKERLEGARFRFLNEMLYTSHSKQAVAAFKKDPTSFEVYHQGYRRQIEKWPVKPIDLVIGYVKSRPKSDVIADLGCGDAKLAVTVGHKVHSFDIRSLNDRVVVADMAKLPLEDESVNVVVYCLSLMGTNLTDFIVEAHRVLVEGGVIWIAEVASRFNRDIKSFSDSVESVGFKCTSCKADMSHFVTLTFKKTKPASLGSKVKRSRVDISLAPCLYKKR